jgi:hypothetical protein
MTMLQVPVYPGEIPKHDFLAEMGYQRRKAG